VLLLCHPRYSLGICQEIRKRITRDSSVTALPSEILYRNLPGDKDENYETLVLPLCHPRYYLGICQEIRTRITRDTNVTALPSEILYRNLSGDKDENYERL
jgi:hypothetical protein